MSQLVVRQGDILSPTLFNIFVNYLPHPRKDVTKPSCQRMYREFWECHVHTKYAKSKVGHNTLRSYNTFKNIFKTEPYLINQSLYKYQKILAKFRLSAHGLRIETARYNSKIIMYYQNKEYVFYIKLKMRKKLNDCVLCLFCAHCLG